MTNKLTRWDSAQYLDSEEAIQAYLDACVDESNGDPAFIVYALGVIARARNVSQLSRDTGISREGLYKAFSSEGNPTFSTIAKVASALGLTLTLKSTKTTS
jgi:probable addiction module antidote protein